MKEDKDIVQKKNESIRFKVSETDKKKIEKAADKRKLTISEYVRQTALNKAHEHTNEWYSVMSELEAVADLSEGDARDKLVALIHKLYKGGA